MRSPKSVFHFACVFAAAACLASLTAWADTTTYDTKPLTAAEPRQSAGPSANNEAYRKLKMQCETEAACGKASGDVCVQAAALLVGEDLPDEFREVGEDQRVKIALRLLERGVDNSNLARGKAYDWYNKVGFLGVSSYADSYRAKELMDMMEKSGYPGGTLRKIRGMTSILSFSANEADKRAGCATAKKLLSEGKLDADSTSIAKDIVGSGICTGYEPPK